VTIKNVGSGDKNYGNGKSITAKVVDTCPGCDPDHLDLSVDAFKALTGGQPDPLDNSTSNGQLLLAPHSL
jgi:hypothetical protein